MNDVEILEEALTYLWDGESESDYDFWHVCNCIKEVGQQARPSTRLRVINQTRVILKEIDKRLNRLLTLDLWLKSQGVEIKKFSKKDFQNHRKQWMLNMIQEAKDNGGYLKC